MHCVIMFLGAILASRVLGCGAEPRLLPGVRRPADWRSWWSRGGHVLGDGGQKAAPVHTMANVKQLQVLKISESRAQGR